MIDVKNLHKYFGSLEVLKGIDCHIDKGECVCVIGPSGSGKSTFLRCLNLLETPTKGDIVIDDMHLTEKDFDVDAMRKRVGMVFQHFGHSQAFRVYDVQDGKIITAETVPTQGSGHGALAGFLAAQGVDTLICGGIGAGARQALAQAGIRLFPGVQGPADEAVKSLLAGTLAYDPDTVCTHHHGEGHEAGHSCAHGGEDGCRHGSCGA